MGVASRQDDQQLVGDSSKYQRNHADSTLNRRSLPEIKEAARSIERSPTQPGRLLKRLPKELKEIEQARHDAYTSNASTSNAGDRVQHLIEQIERKSKKMNSKSQISIRNATKN